MAHLLNPQTEKVIGVVGGMGPQAGTDLLDHISRLTNATRDQHHRSVILMSFPGRIADRTAFVEGREKTNPGYSIARIIGQLERAGATVAGIACNSAHIPAIYTVILEALHRAGSKIRLLHMPRETCQYTRDRFPRARRVGVLATNGVYRSGLYRDHLRQTLFEPVLPDFPFQDEVIHRMIYDPVFGIKARPDGITAEARELLDKALHYFESRGVEVIILGCTEFSLIVKDHYAGGLPVVNSNEVLARALIRETEDNAFETSVNDGLAVWQGASRTNYV
jgi:aspartate racemase